MKIVVLGGGRVGSAITRDLAAVEGWEITVADMSRESLDRFSADSRIMMLQADLSSETEIHRVTNGQDLVVGAVPGTMGFATLRSVIKTGLPVVDISFFEEDPFELDELAKKHGSIVLTDCGVAPGCSNLIIGHMEEELDEVESFSCYVGGLPVVRNWPYEYRAVFSPIDVIAEYTRPSRLVEGGKVVVKDALTEIEHLDFAGVGTLEAFNTDGLRSLIRTCKAPDMKEKTMRYPGHADRMKMLRDTGFFDEQAISVGGKDVRPIDLTAKLLFAAWQLPEGEQDITVMRVEVVGSKGGQRIRTTYDLLDRYDLETGTTSMARTTGYTCTAVVHALAKGMYTTTGVSPAEYLGRQPGCLDFVFEYLEQRNVVFHKNVEVL